MNDTLTGSLQPLLGVARQRMSQGLAELRAQYQAHPQTAALLKGRAALVDGEVAQLWAACGMPETAAVVAVGGSEVGGQVNKKKGRQADR